MGSIEFQLLKVCESMKLIDMLCAVMLRYACVWQVYGADPSETGIGAECVGGTWSDVGDVLCTTRHLAGCHKIHKPVDISWRNSTNQTNQTQGHLHVGEAWHRSLTLQAPGSTTGDCHILIHFMSNDATLHDKFVWSSWVSIFFALLNVGRCRICTNVNGYSDTIIVLWYSWLMLVKHHWSHKKQSFKAFENQDDQHTVRRCKKRYRSE